VGQLQSHENGDYAGSCMPFGWIRSFTPIRCRSFRARGTYVSVQAEHDDRSSTPKGLPHRPGLPPSWFGDSRGHWEGDALVIESVNFNGFAKLGTIGHPMSENAKLTMTFKRPDMGHIEFKWVLDDPKTYTRPITNERVFVLTPNVEVMEYACMEGNITALLDGGIVPWTGSKDSDTNLVYDKEHEWSAYDLGKSQTITGVIRVSGYHDRLPNLKLDVNGKTLTVVLAPVTRMEFRDLTDMMLQPGVSVTSSAISKSLTDEFRAESITVASNDGAQVGGTVRTSYGLVDNPSVDRDVRQCNVFHVFPIHPRASRCRTQSRMRRLVTGVRAYPGASA
jgi:hypothetical protein